MEWAWLVLLLCPLMMLPMMFMMIRGERSDRSKTDYQKNMIQELEQLKKHNKSM